LKKLCLLSGEVCEIIDENVKAPHICNCTVTQYMFKSSQINIHKECYCCQTVSTASLRNKKTLKQDCFLANVTRYIKRISPP